MDQEPPPNKQIAGDRLLKRLGIEPNKWTVGDRRIALLGLGIGLLIVIIAVCGYVFGWAWTGLTKPQRTFWDWLSLLIVPIVLALGGYLFNRSESRRTKEDAERQRRADRQIAEQRAQDNALQAYLDDIGELLLDEDKPLRKSGEGDEVRTLARARTLTVLASMAPSRKTRIMQFLVEADLVQGGDEREPIIRLSGVDLTGADLSYADLSYADLSCNFQETPLGTFESCADLSGADLIGAHLIGANLSGADLSNTNLSYALVRAEELDRARSLEGATMPNGQKYEDWIKDREGRKEDG